MTKKDFLLRFETRIGETEMSFFMIDKGKNKKEVTERNEVEHKHGLDTENSPIGGANGQYFTELYSVTPITLDQKKFLNSIGIH